MTSAGCQVAYFSLCLRALAIAQKMKCSFSLRPQKVSINSTYLTLLHRFLQAQTTLLHQSKASFSWIWQLRE